MRKRILRHLRPRSAAYLATGVLVGAGGSYALAATSTKTITACADKGTGTLHLRLRGRCTRRQTRVSWNQRGPQGPQGKQGPAGTPAVSIWAVIGSNGVAGPQHGLSVQRMSAGVFQVTVTDSTCAQKENAPVVSVQDANPPVGKPSGGFPVAWSSSTSLSQFTVFTGAVAAGTFSLSDRGFDVYDTC
jgi:hypothetical protein